MKTFRLSLLFIFVLGLCTLPLNAQRALTVEDLVSWKRISERAISDDGRWVAVCIAPWDGDSSVNIYDSKGKEVGTYEFADKVEFSSSSDYLLMRIVPSRALTDSLKLAKTKKDKMPMNSLLIRRLAGGEETIDSVKSYKLAETGDWIAYQRTEKDKTLTVRSLDGGSSYSFPDVSEFGFADKSSMFYLHSKGDTLGIQAGLYILDPAKGEPRLVKEGKEVFKNITWDRKGERLAFLWCEHKDSTYKNSELWIDNGTAARIVPVKGNRAIPEGWVVSENGRISFSENGQRLFFGTSPEPRQKDTTRLAEYRPDVHIWNWDEPVQYTVQDYNRQRDMKKSYQAVYNINRDNVVQLATREFPDVQLGDEGNAPVALVSTSEPYSLSSMWEAATRRDVQTVMLENGERRPLLTASYDSPMLSPKAKYAAVYSRQDSVWYTIDISTGKINRLRTPSGFIAWNEDFDMPDYPSPYGFAGWTEDDSALLIYDRYDIWRMDPSGNSEAVNLTVDGRSRNITYRYMRLDREERFIDTGKRNLISGFNNTTKGSGYYEATLSAPAAPKALVAGNFALRFPTKAKNSDAVIYTKETFSQFPELLLSDMTFKKSLQLTHLGDQQKGVRWGTAELVSWISLDGQRIEGVLYKPEGFNPNRKYPLLVNFYERSSETLYGYRTPSPGRSTIDYPMYLSNEYVIFNPDVVYSNGGYPGQDCYDCVMPGIMSLIEQGFIDEKAIGAQGHSWGGYQVAYLATRTNLFAAIESGAPVVNMFSAYGGIRWGSGMARAFQYEHTQSRIGGTPWSAPREFFESSPLFHMDKVNTPLLIMHNDQDGHVPWYQGIEYFVALKRLGKPSWLLNYTGEIHWPEKMANRIDFQKRMFQFFDHYLKGAPMPSWMSTGVRAADRDFELGYEAE